ncbi:MAG: SirB2 family protein [Pseudomonadota bacterium]
MLTKMLHTFAAVLTICGFILRGYWMMSGSQLLQHRLTKILPHVVDTVFLLAGIALVWMLSMNVLTQPWLLAKIVGLIVYIVLGTIAIKRGRTKEIRIMAFTGALAVYAWVAGVAIAKSPASWLAMFAG